MKDKSGLNNPKLCHMDSAWTIWEHRWSKYPFGFSALWVTIYFKNV